jgi:hypothetical protein
VQSQRPPAGELPPRVHSLGAAQFVGKNPLAGPVCQSTARDSPGQPEDRVWPRQESHRFCFSVRVPGFSWPAPSSYMQRPGGGGGGGGAPGEFDR